MADDVAGCVDEVWEKGDIPDEAVLYMRVHRNHIDPKTGQVDAAAFRDPRSKEVKQRDPEERFSTNWKKYATPEQTRFGARKPPQEYAVIKLKVSDIRTRVEGQRVEHSPDRERKNRAHTDVFGKKDVKVRSQFQEICEKVLPVEGIDIEG